jgi:hypothetical protein
MGINKVIFNKFNALIVTKLVERTEMDLLAPARRTVTERPRLWITVRDVIHLVSSCFSRDTRVADFLVLFSTGHESGHVCGPVVRNG